MKIKRNKWDKVFSDCVRERASWHCEDCGKWFGDNTGGLDCSHYRSRRHYATRFDPDNAIAQCKGCHQFGDGFTFGVFKRVKGIRTDKDPVELEALLEEKSNQTVKRRDYECPEMLAHYKDQLKIMQEKRANGDDGYIDFEGWI